VATITPVQEIFAQPMVAMMGMPSFSALR
jgi:hypothetical protein